MAGKLNIRSVFFFIFTAMNQLTLTGVHLNITAGTSNADGDWRRSAAAAAPAYVVGAGVELLKGNFIDDGSVVVMRHHEEVIPPYQSQQLRTQATTLCCIVCQACLEEGKCTPTAAVDCRCRAALPPPIALCTLPPRRCHAPSIQAIAATMEI